MKRNRLLIYPKFQLALVAVNLVSLTVCFGTLGVMVSRTLDGVRKIGQEAQLPVGHPLYTFLEFQARDLSAGVSIAVMVGFILSTIFSLAVSHRLAGPIHRLRGFMTTLAEGKTPEAELKFRKGDFFDDLPPLVNRAVMRVRTGKIAATTVAAGTDSSTEKKAA